MSINLFKITFMVIMKFGGICACFAFKLLEIAPSKIKGFNDPFESQCLLKKSI